MAGPDIPFVRGGGGGHEIRLNAKGTVGSFGGRKLIYNKFRGLRDVSCNIYTHPIHQQVANVTV